MNLTNITGLENYKPRVEIITIFPPGWNSTIERLQKENWQNKNLIRNIYKYQDTFWNYMKEKNIIPGGVVEKIENQTEYMEFWK